MKATNTIEELRKTAHAFRLQLDELRTKSDDLQEVAKREAMPRIERLDTMISALERDIGELENENGANMQTTIELAGTINQELTNLGPELEALSQGNPTTVSSVFDASLDAVEKAGEAIKKATSKIPLMK